MEETSNIIDNTVVCWSRQHLWCDWILYINTTARVYESNCAKVVQH